MRRSTLLHLLYQLIRLSPAAAFLLFGTFPRWIDSAEIEAPVTATISALTILIVWGMAESTLLLWLKAKAQLVGLKLSGPSNTGIPTTQTAQSKSRGYAIVTAILGLSLLPLLQVFRGRVTEFVFVTLLVGLSMRGLSRSAFSQRKLTLACASAALSALLFAVMSFGIFRPNAMFFVSWQALLIGVAFGGILLATELAWNGDSLAPQLPEKGAGEERVPSPPQISQGKWLAPTFRLAVFGPPVIIATLAFLGQLPLMYSFLYLIIPLGHRAVQHVSAQATPTMELPREGIIFSEQTTSRTIITEAAILLGCLLCRGHSNGWF